jgi:hypothetical protein
MRLLTHLLGRPVTRRSAVVAAGAPFASLLGGREPAPRLLACGWCYEENGEEVHPHPECPIGQPDPDEQLAASELQGQLARLQSRVLAMAQQLEARYQRYTWTEQLAQDLRAIAHDTPPMGG